jgi:hypothetical protein
MLAGMSFRLVGYEMDTLVPSDFARDRLYETHTKVQPLVATEARLGKPVFLKLHREGYSAAEIGHVVIENALV